MHWLVIAPLLLSPAADAPAAAPQVLYEGKPITWEGLTAAKKGLQQITPVWLMSDGFRPRQTPSLDAKESGAAPILFHQQVLLLGTGLGDFYQSQTKERERFYLVGSPGAGGKGPTILGYVPKSRLIVQNQCLQAPGKIDRKAMVINSLDYIHSEGGDAGAKLRPPHLRLAPEPDGTDLKELRFFDVYFVWADTNPGEDKTGYALLGMIPNFNENSTLNTDQWRDRTQILGWVEKSRLCFWDTREALQWDDDPDPKHPRTEPGVGYATRDKALWVAHFSNKEPDPRTTRPDAPEKFINGKPQVWPGSRMRFPLLKWTNEKGVEFLEEGGFPGNNTLRKVGMIGDVVGENGQVVTNETTRQDINAEIKRRQDQLRRTEILFVIDRTSSMVDWWDRTAKAVKRILDRVDQEGREVSIGFCYYGDVYAGTDHEGKATPEKAVELGGVIPGELFDVKTEKDKLNKQLEYLGDRNQIIASVDRPELVYAGLEMGLRKAQMGMRDDDRNARKMVILIGDDGNHELPPDEEREVQERIAKLCVSVTDEEKDKKKELRTPIEFYALQVAPVSTDPGDATVLFKKQTEALAERIKARSKLASAQRYSADSEAKFLADIDERYRKLGEEILEKEAWLQKIRSGQVSSITEIPDPEVARMVEDIANKEGLDNPDKVLQGVQVFDERYVWSNSPEKGEPQLRRMLLISEPELEDVNKMFNDFETKRPQPSLEDLVDSLIAYQSGEAKPVVKGKSAGDKNKDLDTMRVAYGFSFTEEVAEYLGYNHPDKPPPPRNAVVERDIVQRLQKKHDLIQDLLAHKVYKYKPLNDFDKVNLQRSDEPPEELDGDRRRDFYLGGGRPGEAPPKPGDPNDKVNTNEIWYWVDFDREWP